jgi:hypothetical protein
MRIVDRKFVDKNIHTTRTRHFGALLGATRNGASSTYVSTFDYQ